MPEHLDLARCLSSGQVFRWQKLTEGWLVADGRSWFRIRVADEASGGCRLHVQSNASREAFERLFGLDWDLEHIDRTLLKNAPELKPYMEAMQGLRVMRRSDPSETLYTFLCTVNNHLSRIRAMVGKLARLGTPIDEVEGETIYAFPTSEVIAALPEARLRAEGFGYRAASIPAAARALLARPPGWLEGLALAPYEEAHAELQSLPGVGPKVADCVCLFGLGHTCAAPVDTHIWQAVRRLYLPEWREDKLTPARYKASGQVLRARFGDLAGWAQQYLFYESVLNWRSRERRP